MDNYSEGEKRKTEFDRRNFLKGSAFALAGVVTSAGLVGCSDESDNQTSGSSRENLPTNWDYETEICIVGGGGAGLSAGITAIKEGLGEPLLVEYAPEEEIGGNSRVCGQLLFIPTSVEGAITYQTGLNGAYEVEPELIRSWAENICENVSWLNDLGLDLVVIPTANPEYAEIPGSESCEVYYPSGITPPSAWNFLKETADDLGLKYQYNTRVTELIFDPASKEVFGVKGVCAGKDLYIKAKKGVILACGGFENNQKMLQQYYTPGYPELGFLGSPYNQGDGITMAISVGAELHNMSTVAGHVFGTKIIDKDLLAIRNATWASRDYVYVGPDAKRFCYEETTTLTKHGYYNTQGVWAQLNIPPQTHVIFGSKSFEGADLFPQGATYGWHSLVGQPAYTNQELLDLGFISKAETIAELAQTIGFDTAALEETLTTYNANCAKGIDPDFKRGQDFWYSSPGVEAGEEDTGEMFVAVPAFDLEALEPPYYAMPYYKMLLNTQGGPKRNVEGAIVDIKGNAIPRLCAAGEMGTIYRYIYNGGGNFSDAISSGRLAARTIGSLRSWES